MKQDSRVARLDGVFFTNQDVSRLEEVVIYTVYGHKNSMLVHYIQNFGRFRLTLIGAVKGHILKVAAGLDNISLTVNQSASIRGAVNTNQIHTARTGRKTAHAHTTIEVHSCLKQVFSLKRMVSRHA